MNGTPGDRESKLDTIGAPGDRPAPPVRGSGSAPDRTDVSPAAGQGSVAGRGRRLYRYVWRISGRQQMWLGVLAALIIPLAPIPLELQRRIVNQAIGRLDLDMLWLLGAMYMGIVLLQSALKFALGVYRGIVNETAIRRLRRGIYCGAQGGGSATGLGTDPPTQGSTVSMIVAEVEPIGGFVGDAVAVPVLSIGVLASTLSYMLWTQPLVATVALLLYVPQFYVVPKVQSAINRHAQRRIGIVRRVTEHVVDASGDTMREEIAWYEGQIGAIYRERVHIFWLKHALKIFSNLLHHMGALSVLLFGGWLAIAGRADLGTVVAFVYGLERVGGPWRDLVAFYRQMSDAQARYRLVEDALERCG